LLLLFSSMKLSFGIRKIRHNVTDYDRIILCGPIWMGKLISPLRDFIGKHRKSIKELYFVSCCGSGYAIKDQKFGHGLVFQIVKEILGDKCVHCEAYPIGLVVPEDQRENPDTVMKVHLTDENFKGEIEERFNTFLQTIQG